MHNLCMLVGSIDGGVETICDVAAVGIAVAEGHGVRICSVGHDALSKMLVYGRNDTDIFRGIGVVYKVSVSKAEESEAM